MNSARSAAVGDLLIQNVDNRAYIGIVSRVTSDKYNHKTVFVLWNGTTPPMYNENYGFPWSNIHNLRREFELIKG